MIDPPEVDRVIDGLYIASARAAYQAPALRKAGITRVLKLYENGPAWPPDFRLCDNPVEDGAWLPSVDLWRGTAFVQEGLAAGEKVLVVCAAGVSRSATFVLACLVERGYDLRQAWDLLREKHPQAWPALELWESLLRHYKLPYTMRDVVEWLKLDVLE